MKKTIYLLALFFSMLGFSQKKVVKKIETDVVNIIINTEGLDQLIIENSKSNYVEVILNAENYEDQLINVYKKNNETQVAFEFEGFETREVIFRKFITKRLQRANATVKIPKGKKVTVFGQTIDIESKSLNRNLDIYIENGIVKLNTIKANTLLKLYSGSVFASIKNTNIDVKSSSGRIEIDGKIQENEYQIQQNAFKKNLTVTTLKANLFFKSK